MEMINIKNVTYKYPVSKEYALKNINLDIKKGELCAIIGANGSGKTTLCNVIRGFVPEFYEGDFKGDVFIKGNNIKDIELGELATDIGFVFQNPFTQTSGVKETVFEEIAFGLENLGIEKNLIIERVNKTLKLLSIENLKDKNPFELSGGQRQRVALASIIVMDPEILVIDEPTSQLDPKSTEEVFKIIKLMKEKGKTIVLVEHKINLIAEYADKVVVMKDGEIVLDGPTKEVLTNKDLDKYESFVPEYVLLGNELRKENLPLENIPLTMEEAVSEVSTLLGSREEVIR